MHKLALLVDGVLRSRVTFNLRVAMTKLEPQDGI
jgi:hypothetical protein